MEQKKWAVVGVVALFVVLPVVTYFTVPVVESVISILLFDVQNYIDGSKGFEDRYEEVGSHRIVLEVNGEQKVIQKYNATSNRRLVVSEVENQTYAAYSPDSSRIEYLTLLQQDYKDSSLNSSNIYTRSWSITRSGEKTFFYKGIESRALYFLHDAWRPIYRVTFDEGYEQVGRTTYDGHEVLVFKKARRGGLPTTDIPVISEASVLYIDNETGIPFYGRGITQDGDRFKIQLETDVSPTIEEPEWTDKVRTHSFKDVQALELKTYLDTAENTTLTLSFERPSRELLLEGPRTVPVTVHKNRTTVASDNFTPNTLFSENSELTITEAGGISSTKRTPYKKRLEFNESDSVKVVVGQNGEFVFNKADGRNRIVKDEWRVREEIDVNGDTVTVRYRGPTSDISSVYRVQYGGKWKTLAKNSPPYKNKTKYPNFYAIPPQTYSASFERDEATHVVGCKRDCDGGAVLIPFEERSSPVSGTLKLEYNITDDPFSRAGPYRINIYNRTMFQQTGNYSEAKIAEFETPRIESIGNIPGGDLLIRVDSENTTAGTEAVKVTENSTVDLCVGSELSQGACYR